MELSKANFKVFSGPLDHSADDIFLAARSGDGVALRALKKNRMDTVAYFVVFDVIKLEPTAWDVKGGNGELAGSLLELGFSIATKGQNEKAGKSLRSTVESLKYYDYKTTWSVAVKYSVISASDGSVAASDTVSDSRIASTELTAAIGASQKTATGPTTETLLQKVVQRAILDLDKSHKLALNSKASSPQHAAGKNRNEKEIKSQYVKKLEQEKTKKDAEAAIGTLRSFMFSYSILDAASVSLLSAQSIQPIIAKELLPFFQLQHAHPDWRDMLTIDISNLTYELIEYTPEKCKIRVGGHIIFGKKGKEQNVPSENEILDVVKENGVWKVGSIKIKKVKDT